MSMLGCWRFLCNNHLRCRWRTLAATSPSLSLLPALLVGDMAQGTQVLEKNKTSISCSSADGGDRGRDKLQSYSLQNCPNDPWLSSIHQQIVHYARWAMKWKQTASYSQYLMNSLPKFFPVSLGISVLIQTTNHLEHFLFSSHWMMELWRFQETCFSLLIILPPSIHLSHFLIFLCSFFLCWCTVSCSYSQVNSLLAREEQYLSQLWFLLGGWC